MGITHLIFEYDKKKRQEGWTKKQTKANRVSKERKVDFQTGVPGASDKVKAIIALVVRSEGQKYYNVFVVARFDNGQYRTIFKQTETSKLI